MAQITACDQCRSEIKDNYFSITKESAFSRFGPVCSLNEVWPKDVHLDCLSDFAASQRKDAKA